MEVVAVTSPKPSVVTILAVSDPDQLLAYPKVERQMAHRSAK